MPAAPDWSGSSGHWLHRLLGWLVGDRQLLWLLMGAPAPASLPLLCILAEAKHFIRLLPIWPCCQRALLCRLAMPRAEELMLCLSELLKLCKAEDLSSG